MKLLDMTNIEAAT